MMVYVSISDGLILQRLEHGICRVFVEFDIDLGPKIVREFVQLPAGGDGHQERLRLLVYGEFGDADGVGQHLNRTTQVQCAHDDGPTTCVAAQERAAECDNHRKPQTDTCFVRVNRAHLDRKLLFARVAVANKFFCANVEVLLAHFDTFAKGRRRRLIQDSYPTARTACYFNPIEARSGFR